MRIWQIAAAVLLAISTVSTYLLVKNGNYSKDLIECYIPTAEIRELTLPDGSRVILNSKSTLFYPEQFSGETRSVYLTGDAYFQVKPDKKHPFIVKETDFQTTALETEFNVNSYSENKEVNLTLISGSMKVEFNHLMSSVILKPNEQLTYNKETQKHSLQQPQIDDVTAWQRGDLIFGNAYLKDIFTSLESVKTLMLLPIAFIASKRVPIVSVFQNTPN